MNVKILEKCPACDGTGQIKPSLLLTDEIENNISYLIHEQNERKLTLMVHPFIYAYIKQGTFNLQWKWYRKFHQWINVKSQNSNHFLEYHFFDKNGDEIKM